MVGRFLILLGLLLCNIVVSTIPKVNPDTIFLELNSAYDTGADQSFCVGERHLVNFILYPKSSHDVARLLLEYDRVVFLKGYSAATCPGKWLGTVSVGIECCYVGEGLAVRPADFSMEGFAVLPSDWTFPSGQARLRLTLPVALMYTKKGSGNVTLPTSNLELHLTIGCENNAVDPAGKFTCVNKAGFFDGDPSNGHLTVSGSIRGGGLRIYFSPTTDVVSITSTLLSSKSLTYFQNPNPQVLLEAGAVIQFPVPL